MRVEELSVRNFTSLTDVSLHNLPDLVVFIGKNSSGKSNLIDALTLLFTEFGNKVNRELGSPDDYHHLFPNHNTQISPSPEIKATMALTPEEWAQLLAVSQDVGRAFEHERLFVGKHLITISGLLKWGTETIGIGKNPFATDESVITVHSSPESISIDVIVDEFLPRLDELLKSGFSVIHTTENARSWPDRFVERPTIIDAEHVSGLWKLSQSKGNQRQPWTKVTEQYVGIAPNKQRPVGVASSIQLEEGALSIPIGMTGEGSQAMLRLIDQLERGSPIMAIEEPETHLHPALIKRIGQLLTETTKKGKQLFICTHSPFLVEQSSLDSYFVVNKQGNETLVSPMRDITGLRSLLLDIGIRPSDILFCNAILVVEGLSDEIFFNDLSNKINVPLVERHVKIVRANGFPRGKYKLEFWAEVGRDAGLPLYLVLDKNARDEAEGAIGKGQIPREHCLILNNGDLEDHYPWRVLKEILSTQYTIEVEEPIALGERVKELVKLLSRKGKGKNGWKPEVAEAVVKSMTLEEAQSEMGETVSFLRRIHHEVSVE